MKTKKLQTGFTTVELVIVLMVLLMFVPFLGLSIYGIVLAFQAHILLGVAFLILSETGLPFIGAILYLGWDYNLAAKVVAALT